MVTKVGKVEKEAVDMLGSKKKFGNEEERRGQRIFIRLSQSPDMINKKGCFNFLINRDTTHTVHETKQDSRLGSDQGWSIAK